MTISVGPQLTPLAGLFLQSAQRTAEMAIGDNVAATMEVLQLSLVRQSQDRTFTSAPIAAVGLVATPAATFVVPVGKMWAITGLTVALVAGTDNLNAYACIANANGNVLIVSQLAGATAAGVTNPVAGAGMWPIPFFLKPGDQVSAWVGKTLATGDSTVTVSFRFVELPAF